MHDSLHCTDDDSESDCTCNEVCGDVESVESDSDEPVVRFHVEEIHEEAAACADMATDLDRDSFDVAIVASDWHHTSVLNFHPTEIFAYCQHFAYR